MLLTPSLFYRIIDCSASIFHEYEIIVGEGLPASQTPHPQRAGQRYPTHNAGAVSILDLDKKEKQVTLIKQTDQDREAKLFCFDEVLTTTDSQAQVFESIATNLITKVVEGYNGTIFAYGQTGSGKTHTMVGNAKSQELMGIVPRSFERIIELMESQENKNFLMRCSFMEIYN